MCHHIEFKEQGEKTAIMNGQKINKTLGAMKFEGKNKNNNDVKKTTTIIVYT